MRCPKCGEPTQIIAFVLNRPVIEHILDHIGDQLTEKSRLLGARRPSTWVTPYHRKSALTAPKDFCSTATGWPTYGMKSTTYAHVRIHDAMLSAFEVPQSLLVISR